MEIPAYRRGQWTTVPHPVPDTEWTDYGDWMNEGGYANCLGLTPGGDGNQLMLMVWGHGHVGPTGLVGVLDLGEDAPEFLVDVEINGSTRTVAAGDVVDLMGLLAQWVPVVKFAVECDISIQALEG